MKSKQSFFKLASVMATTKFSGNIHFHFATKPQIHSDRERNIFTLAVTGVALSE